MSKLFDALQYTEFQGGVPVTVNAAGGAAPVVNLAKSNSVSILLTANATISAPTNVGPVLVGTPLVILLIQDATGGRTVAWNAIYRNVPTLTGSAANSRAMLIFRWDGVSWQYVGGAVAFV